MADANLTAPTTLRVAVQKPKFNIYYVLLIIALCAMIVSCGVLYTYIREFGGFGSVKGKVSAIGRPAIQFSRELHAENKSLC